MRELNFAMGYVDKLKHIKQGDYVKITYNKRKVKEGFYIDDLNGLWKDDKGKVNNKMFKGVFLFREVELSDRSKDYGKKENVYRGDEHYIVERIKDDEGNWLEEIDSIEVVEDYVRELHQSEVFYIHFESYLKELEYLRTKRPIQKEYAEMFKLADWDRIVKRVGVRDSNIEEFIRRVILIKQHYKGVGYVRSSLYEMPLDIN